MNEIKIKSYELGKVEDLTKMAVVLKNHIVKQKLYSNIKGKNYAHVEGWQFAGGMLGLSPRIVSVENLSSGNEIKWRAAVELIHSQSGKVVGNGFALCSNKETIKKGFDEYAILSMSQTRAIGKAYRNLIGWVMKLANFEGTPAEEMHKVGEEPRPPAEPVIQIGQVKGPEGKPVYVCSKCDKIITEAEARYSMKVYKKRLCRDCQKELKTKKWANQKQ